jgi:hypothetical protein
MAGYGMFRSIHEPDQIDFHLQATIDRLTLLLYKSRGREEQLRQLNIVAGLSLPPAMSDHTPGQASPLVLTPVNMLMANLDAQEHEIRSWLIKNTSK